MAFVQNHSTEYAAVKLVDNVGKEMELGNTPTALYINLSNAFDTLSFDILLYKLNYYGIKDNAFKLLKNYLKSWRSENHTPPPPHYYWLNQSK